MHLQHSAVGAEDTWVEEDNRARRQNSVEAHTQAAVDRRILEGRKDMGSLAAQVVDIHMAADSKNILAASGQHLALMALGKPRADSCCYPGVRDIGLMPTRPVVVSILQADCRLQVDWEIPVLHPMPLAGTRTLRFLVVDTPQRIL